MQCNASSVTGWPGLRHDGSEAAVADDWIGQREAGHINEPRKALIYLIELGRGKDETAMVQELGIALELEQVLRSFDH